MIYDTLLTTIGTLENSGNKILVKVDLLLLHDGSKQLQWLDYGINGNRNVRQDKNWKWKCKFHVECKVHVSMVQYHDKMINF